MALLGTIDHLHASGPGLMLCSPEAVESLEEGSDTMPAGGDLREPLRSLVSSQRVVLLQTGSPQLYYGIEVHDGPPEETGAAARCRFGMHIEGGVLWVRDGDDPMKWERMPDTIKPVPLLDGYYSVDALWIPNDRKGVMDIRLYFAFATAPLPGDGRPELPYRAPE